MPIPGTQDRFKSNFKLTVLVTAALILAAGCHGKQDAAPPNFKAAINDYSGTHQECVWSNSVKFPVQVDANKDSQTRGFDALTDAGLLTRKAAEKKRFLIGSKQVTNYDVSEKGRSAWTVDPSQPGYGNFCYGHRDVASVDSFTTATNASGAHTAIVNYHYTLAGVPDWARAGETQSAFPAVQTALAGPQPATVSLVQTTNGWQVSNP